MYIIGHRGAAYYAPENTMKAIQIGLEKGADGVEIDTHMLLSGEMVVIHDYNFLRTTGVYLNVKKAKLDKVRKLRFNGEPIPMLDEVLDFVPDSKIIQVELKSDVRTVPTLLSTIKASRKSIDEIIVIGFDYEALSYVKMDMPNLKVAWINGETKRKKPMQDRQGLLHLVKAAKFDAVDFDQRFDIGKDYVDFMKGNGVEMYSWTVDDVQRQNYFREIGVRGIATNKPDKIDTVAALPWIK